MTLSALAQVANYPKWSNDPCKFMQTRSFLERSQIWLRRNLVLANSRDPVPKPMLVDEKLYSKMHYVEECYDDAGNVRTAGEVLQGYQYIEPLVGILRDPITICNTYPENLKNVVRGLPLDNQLDLLQSKRAILLSHNSPMVVVRGNVRLDTSPSPCVASETQLDAPCRYIRPPFFHRPLFPIELAQHDTDVALAAELGMPLLTGAHNLRRSRVILMDLGASYYQGWKGIGTAARCAGARQGFLLWSCVVLCRVVSCRVVCACVSE